MTWYLWTGEYSSLFGKRAMTTFERYFIKEKETQIFAFDFFYRCMAVDDMAVIRVEAEFLQDVSAGCFTYGQANTPPSSENAP
jgi:fructose-1,6-bisphosphatase